MENVQSAPSLGIVKQEFNDVSEDDLEENKENLVPGDFDSLSIDSLAQQLIRSAKKSRTSKLYNRHSITVEGIESPQITCHAMITRLDEIKNTLKKDLCTHSVAESKYIYEHIKSDSNVFKSRRLFPSAFEPEISSVNIVESKEINDKDCTQIQYNQCHVKKKMVEVLNSQDRVQVIENKELGHSGVRVLEKQLHTTLKPFSFDSCKSSVVVTPQDVKGIKQHTFKARTATVLKTKPFVPKHEKRYTEPKNIHLNTERRAKERMVFKQEMEANFLHQEEISRKRQEEIRKKEMDLIRNMRQLTIHKPEPIKKYKPIVIRKSVRPVTVPHSPRFSARLMRNCSKSMCA